MILVYHKIDLTSRTYWYVSVDTFDRQMAALQAYDVVTLDAYDPNNPRHAVITFDGVYENVWRSALPILKKWHYPFELFVIGDYIGRDNSFDQHVEPPCRFASLDMLDDMAANGGRIQWHTRTHPKLDTVPLEAVAEEITVPHEVRRRFASPHLDWFAYPHDAGRREVTDLVRQNFRGALACQAGNDKDRYRLNRTTVIESTKLSKTRVSLIVANFNYGRYLREAMDSVLRQTIAPDEIIVIDDASTDESASVMEDFVGLATLVHNERNLGIVDNFRKAVSLTKGDYVAILGADNRVRSDYVERCKSALDGTPAAGFAYTDMTIFGPLASILATQVSAASTAMPDVFVWSFPEPTPEVLAQIRTRNIFHGSSMYRRSAYDAVGGYEKAEVAEDHHLFRRMLDAGFAPVHVRHAVVEYRQHSQDQANTRLGLELLAARLRRNITTRARADAKLIADQARVIEELQAVLASFATRSIGSDENDAGDAAPRLRCIFSSLEKMPRVDKPTTVERRGTDLVLQARDDDPIMYVSVPDPTATWLLLTLDIVAAADETLQVFTTTIAEPKPSQTHSMTRTVAAGASSLSFLLVRPNPINLLRIDPLSRPGVVIVQSMKIFAPVVPSP